MSDRIFECWLGQQASGKTFALNRRIDTVAGLRAVSSVWVLDVTGEWLGLREGDPVVSSWAEYYQSGDHLPRVLVFRDALDWVGWPRLVEEAQAQGRVCLVLDEVYNWLPASKPLEPAARSAVLAGRHLPALDRKLYPLHLIVAAQYPRSVHHLLTEQANTIVAGRMEGELAESWVRGNFGPDRWDEIQALDEHAFMVLRGERPKAKGVIWR